MSFKKYVKRGIEYIIYGFKPQIVYVKPCLTYIKNRFKDKVVLITGGSDGIGLSIAKKFHDEGAKVVITGRNEEKLKKAASLMENCEYIKNDISIIKEQKKLIDYIFKKYKTLDIVVSNAGVSFHEKNFLEVSEVGFDEQFNINLKGGYFLAQNCIKKKKENLSIIFITSERGSQCDYLPYGLTKVSINSLIEGLSSSYYKKGIRINGIAPGVTASGMTKIEKDGDLYKGNSKSGRFFVPEEVAEIVTFIASDAAKCISGEIIHCNGGNHLNSWF